MDKNSVQEDTRVLRLCYFVRSSLTKSKTFSSGIPRAPLNDVVEELLGFQARMGSPERLTEGPRRGEEQKQGEEKICSEVRE